MKIRLTLAVLTLAALPGLAVAQCIHEQKSKVTASSCLTGTIFDPVTGTCKPQPTS